MQIKEIAIRLFEFIRDEHLFIETVRMHGIASILYRAIAEDKVFASKFSPMICDELEKTYYAVAMSNLHRQEELRIVLDACAAKNIEVIVFKGMALAYYVYHDIALRPMSDIDLFVHQEDIPVLEKALLELGYVYFDPFKKEILKELSCGLQFSKEGRFSLEINWDMIQLERIKGVVKFDNTDLWKYSSIYDAGSLSFRVLKPEMQILTLAFHHFLHGFIRLIWLYDIAKLVEVYGSQMDWELMIALSKRYKIKYLTWFVLDASQTLLGAAVPSWVLEKTGPSSFKKSLYKRLIKEEDILFHPCTRKSSKRYLADVFLMDGFLNGMRVIKNIVFPSKAWIANHYDLENSNATRLYRIAHPLFLLRDSITPRKN